MSAVGAAERKYTRILLKLSGEALAGDRGVGFDFERIGSFADQIVEVARMAWIPITAPPITVIISPIV